MKKRIISATLVYLGIWAIPTLSFVFWYTFAPSSAVTQNALFILSYFGVVPFEWSIINCGAWATAIIICYLIWLGVWVGVDKVVGD